jgi:hypothetical protein
LGELKPVTANPTRSAPTLSTVIEGRIHMAETIRVLAWPITIIVVSISIVAIVFIFKKAIIDWINRKNWVKANIGKDNSIEFNVAEQAFVKQTVEITKETLKEEIKDEIKEGVFEALNTSLHYGSYMSNTDAFAIASNWIIDHLNSNLNKKIILDIKITVVGMAYSWPGFVDKIPAWLDQHNECNINLEVLLVSPDYLRRLPIATSPKDWADESQRRVIDLNKLVDGLPPQNRKRLSCAIKTYEAIPQYHGILINNDQLFLGRTDWKYENSPPKDPELTVGQNRYRYFNRATTQGHDRGSERVDLFLHWHRFYWGYQSETVLVFKNGELYEDSNLSAR